MKQLTIAQPPITASTKADRKHINPILQTNLKYNVPKSAAMVNNNPDSREMPDNVIPELYVETIVKGFGAEADLFEDILHLGKSADTRNIRIAYFRRGREILAEGGVQGIEDVGSSEVPDFVRTRFQAVSMAYEILATPAWKNHYLTYGLVSSSPDTSFESKDSLESGGSAGSRPAVRWNEQVEELVFEQAPGEVTAKRKKKKKKAQVLVEASKELEDHLQKLDADTDFVDNFLDNLEESIDGFLKFGDKEKPKTTSPRRAISRRGKSLYPRPSPSESECTSSEGSTWDGSRMTRSSDQATCGSWSGPKTPLGREILPEASQVALNNRNLSPFRPISPTLSANSGTKGNNEEVVNTVLVSPDTKDDKAAVVNEEDDSLLAMESFDFSDVNNFVGFKEPMESFGFNHFKDTENRASVSPLPQNESNDDIFDGIDDDGLFKKFDPASESGTMDPRSNSPGNVSDLSGSVAITLPSYKQKTPRMEQGLQQTLGEPENATKTQAIATSPSPAPDFLDTVEESFEKMFEGESCSEALKSFAKTRALVESSSDASDQGFLQRFIAYVCAIVGECESMGNHLAEMDWKDSLLNLIIVADGDFEEVIRIINEEINHSSDTQEKDAANPPSLSALEAVKLFG